MITNTNGDPLYRIAFRGTPSGRRATVHVYDRFARSPAEAAADTVRITEDWNIPAVVVDVRISPLRLT